ncbi:MAG: prolyl-tRNA synthetase [Phycisphaerales bacterium]|jgi:prolyl-tRNA synthetase
MPTQTPQTSLNQPKTGDIQLWSRALIPTTREAPSDAEMASHVFLSRAGYIRRVTAGGYSYLPLGMRVLQKISDIVREEMAAAGASELLMPAMAPVEWLKETGRAEEYGDLLFRFEDRHGRDSYLCPTHEEVITEMARASVTSYKQLPLSLFQIQSKFRDEARPRAGLLRGREFVMKDAYSFHLTVDGEGGLSEHYDRMFTAYTNIFTRCGLDFSAVEAEAGPIGGSASHEFMVNCESGEDTIMVCPESGYAANVEKCEIGERAGSFDGAAAGELVKHHTPGMPGIEGVAEHLGTNAAGMLKTIVFRTVSVDEKQDEPVYVLAVVRGDHEVNEGKVRDAIGAAVELAPQEQAEADGYRIGYVSPSAAKAGTAVLLVDPDATASGVDGGGWATGADEKDHHVTGWNWAREMGDVLKDTQRVRVASIRNAVAGDPSPRAAGARLEARRGIEVGHIFKLGTKYSEAMGFTVLTKEQKKQSVIMGCYGIGVSRTLAACVEMSHDDNGIVWPTNLAPYHVLITVLKPDEALLAQANSLAGELAQRGVDVLIDDRNERPGPKFKDADLIGLPVRLVLSARAAESGEIEFKKRTDEGKGQNIPADQAIDKCLEALLA